MNKTQKKHLRAGAHAAHVALQIRSVARDLMVYETPSKKSPGMVPHVEFNFNERLRPHIETLYGAAGYRSLLSRALVQADAEVPWLRRMHMKSDGSLDGFEAAKAKLGSEEILEGKVALLSQLLGSLVAYVGPGLARRLVSEVWPKIPLGSLDSDRRSAG